MSGIKRYGWTEEGHEPDLDGNWIQWADHREAVLAERERCAKVAEEVRTIEIDGREYVTVAGEGKDFAFWTRDPPEELTHLRREIAVIIRKDPSSKPNQA